VVAAVGEEHCPLVLVVGVPERIGTFLRHEALVEMLVNGGAPRRAVRHWRDWDPASAEPPCVGEAEVRWRHVPFLVQGARLPLLEVAMAEVVGLLSDGLMASGEVRVASGEL
jgi:hypothetical protein